MFSAQIIPIKRLNSSILPISGTVTLLDRVDLGVITMNVYFTFPKAPGLEP